eukprot:CAMPEP_0113514744 /NCGR_PEP_ID=MMETSP0014_2-20120614/40573_1 /TAXON_ID=2857 /ORGANISM="Nitzschia sp." /LENGTH=625 /DNA_ID=CAMNT_0000411263 /DNA_START=212 /DNA_END=2085 /DNA_ORIENTATION=- /assembly_acc=CAM_ASM_000159
MGRITIFTVDDDCPHCWRAKKALNDRKIPFVEISITQHPSKRLDMLSLSNSLLVPQAFLNSTHLGGADGTIKLLKSWERGKTKALETYTNLVACGADPTDPRLQPPTTPPVVDVAMNIPLEVRRPGMATAVRVPPFRSDFKLASSTVSNGSGDRDASTSGGSTEPSSSSSSSSQEEEEVEVVEDGELNEDLADATESSLNISGGTKSSNSVYDWQYKDAAGGGGSTTTTMSVLEVMELLKKHLRRRKLKYHLTTYYNSFKGRDMIDTLMNIFDFQSREDAVEYALYLQRSPTLQLFGHVVDQKRHDVKDSSKLFFRLQCDQTPSVLNSYRIWTESKEQEDTTDSSSSFDPIGLLKRLKRELNKILRDHTCPKTGRVDYKTAKLTHPDLPALDEAMCELQVVDMMKMSSETKLAFCINLYNTMIRYAFLKVGIPGSDMARSTFFSTVSFNVGGSILSFNDLEHGILRSNKKAPYTLSKPFSSDDERLKLSLNDVDCRIHFALNCGAASCPPVTNFTPDGIQEELRIVSQSFCGDDNNVKVGDGKTLHLSKILYWFQDDFTSTTKTATAADKNTTTNHSVANAILPYLRGSKAAQVKDLVAGSSDIKIKYNHYDWASDAVDSVSFKA